MRRRNRSCHRAPSFIPASRSHRLVRATAEALERRLVLSSIVVNTFVDQNDPPESTTVSLRDAIAQTALRQGPQTIDVPAGDYTLTQGELDLDDTGGAITIQAIGGAAVIGSNVGQIQNNVFDIAAGATVTLQGLMIKGGQAESSDHGGGIANNGTLSARDCTISGNTATSGGDEIYNSGQMTLTNSTVSGSSGGNDNVGIGGGIDNTGTMAVVGCAITGNAAGDGAGIYNSGQMTVSDCTVSENSGAIGVGGVCNTGQLTVIGSTISGNKGDDAPGGIGNYATMTIENSTVYGNTGAGVQNGAISGAHGGSTSTAKVADCTIADNVGYGGIYNASGDSFILANSIVAGNTAMSGGGDAVGVIRSRGHNLIGNPGKSSGWVASDRKGTPKQPLDAYLSPLGSFGGATQTQVPLSGSPAIGAGSVSLIPAGISTDQRGLARTIRGRVDIGAVQTGRSELVVTPPPAQSAVAGESAPLQLGSISDASGTGPFTVVVNWGDGTPPTSFTANTAGSIGPQSHEFNTAGPLQVIVAVVDGSGHVSSGTFSVTAALAPAQTFTVNTPADQTDPASSGTVSLRDAVADAADSIGPVTIAFDPDVFAAAQTITLGSDLEISGDYYAPITFTGPAAGVTVAGAGFDIDPSIAVNFTRFTFAGTGSNYEGIDNSGKLTLKDSSVADIDGVAIQNYGMLTVQDSTISGNSGKGLISKGTAVLENSTVAGNSYDGEPGAAGIENFGGMTITSCAVTGNSGSGGADSGIGNSGQMTIVNSIVAGNTGGAAVDDYAGTMSILDCTITGNNNSQYGGAVDIGPDVGLTLANTIVAGNNGDDVSGTVKSLGHNLIGDDAGGSGFVKSDLLGTAARPIDPDLSSLDSYGGPTQTLIPLSGSPAIGAGSASVVPKGVTTDQRGFHRVFAGRVDIGAAQLQRASVVTLTPPASQSVVAGTPDSIRLGSLTDPGGSGPYTVTVHWGDGSPESQYAVNAIGSLGTETHAFSKVGSFMGTIVVVDGAGDVSNFAKLSISSSATAAETITVNTTAGTTDPAGSKNVSLLDAIAEADAAFGPVTIDFDPKVFATAQSINVGSNNETLDLSDPASINLIGPASGVSLLGASIVIDAGVTASLSRLTITSASQTPGGSGVGIENLGLATVAQCTSAGNVYGIENSGQLSVTHSTFSGNDIAIQNSGRLTVAGCTLSGSAGGLGGGIQNTSGTAAVADTTITSNDAASQSFGGIENDATLTLANSIVAGDKIADVTGTIQSLGHNFIGTGASGAIASDLTGTAADPLDPDLSPLGDYGGLTQTQVPLAGSPLIGAGSVALLPAGDIADQRGFARVVDQKLDIGAVQTQDGPVSAIRPAAIAVAASVPTLVKLGSFSDPGGKGPYTVTVNWGDGTAATAFTVNSAGTFAESHKFATVGPLQGTIDVVDSSGDAGTAATLAIFATPAPARTVTVNTTADTTDPAGSSTVSLRDAVAIADAALGPITISFDPKVFAAPQTLSLGSDLELKTNNFGTVTIAGPAAGVTLGNSAIQVDAGAVATLSRLTVSGGISNYGQTTVADSTVTTFNVTNSGRMTLTDSTITNASIDNMNAGQMSIMASAITGSNEQDGVGGINNAGALTLVESTISGINAPSNGAAIYNTGALTVDDSTIAENQSSLYQDVGGIDSSSTGTVALANSIVAMNGWVVTGGLFAGKAGESDVSGAFTSLGHNLIGAVDGGSSGWIASDLTGTDAHPLNPDLSPLNDYGGPTQTRVLLPGSPAIGAASDALVPVGDSTDQRGFARIVGGKVDIGAAESQHASVLAVTPPRLQSAVAGVPASVQLGSFSEPGGKGPFTVDVDWGDGSPSSSYAVSSIGSLGPQSHTFINTGLLKGTIVVIDGSGDVSNAADFAISSTVAPAKTITVNTTQDTMDPMGSKTVSLRDAVARADASFGPVAIGFDPGVFASSQTLSFSAQRPGPELAENTFGPITIAGPPAGVTLAGTDLFVDTGVTVTLSGLTIPGVTNSGTLTLADSTVSGDFGPGTAAVYNSGGAELTVVNSTITDNGGGIDNIGRLIVADSTITDNFGGKYGGITNTGTLTMANSVVAGNFSGSGSDDVAGPVNSLGHNLIGAADQTGWLASDLTGTSALPLDPGLSLLGDYGGPTRTQVPLAGSPLFGAGSASLIPAGVTTDQRGFSRESKGQVDIGAAQSQKPSTIRLAPPATQTVDAEEPTPVKLGSVTDLAGKGPYTVVVDWGDGSPNSTFTVSTAVTLGSRTHIFLKTGSLAAAIYVIDGSGNVSATGSFSVISDVAPAQTITVNTTAAQTDPAGSKTISLLDAVARADASDGPATITFDPAVFATAQTVKLGSTTLELGGNPLAPIDIIGPQAGLTLTGNFEDGELIEVTHGIVSLSRLTIADSYCGIVNDADLTITNSTISGNNGSNGPALDNSYSGQLTVVNCTIAGNTASNGAGAISNSGIATLQDSTITGNSSPPGSQAVATGINTSLTVANTIIAGNAGGDVSGNVVSLGHNLIGDATESAGWTSSDLTGTDPRPINPHLSPLGNNGGPTKTQVPLPGSTAIGAGSVALVPAGITTDQRGLARIVDGKVDIGAVEVEDG